MQQTMLAADILTGCCVVRMHDKGRNNGNWVKIIIGSYCTFLSNL